MFGDGEKGHTVNARARKTIFHNIIENFAFDKFNPRTTIPEPLRRMGCRIKGVDAGAGAMVGDAEVLDPG
jgi:hypothetical protein